MRQWRQIAATRWRAATAHQYLAFVADASFQRAILLQGPYKKARFEPEAKVRSNCEPEKAGTVHRGKQCIFMPVVSFLP
jgi:hypothetical protein